LSEAIDTECINENEFIRTSTQIDKIKITPVKTMTNGRYAIIILFYCIIFNKNKINVNYIRLIKYKI